MWKLPDGRDELCGNLRLSLVDAAMLSKSLIQFSIDVWSCVSFLWFSLSQTMVGLMVVKATSFKRTVVVSAPILQPATVDPRLH